MTFHKVLVLINLVANEQKFNYYNKVLEKCLCKDKSNIEYF